MLFAGQQAYVDNPSQNIFLGAVPTQVQLLCYQQKARRHIPMAAHGPQGMAVLALCMITESPFHQ